jgi:hypothetical protein
VGWKTRQSLVSCRCPSSLSDCSGLTCASNCLRRGDAEANTNLRPLTAFSAGKSSGGGGRGGPRGLLGLAGALEGLGDDDAVSYDGGGSFGIKLAPGPSGRFSSPIVADQACAIRWRWDVATHKTSDVRYGLWSFLMSMPTPHQTRCLAKMQSATTLHLTRPSVSPQTTSSRYLNLWI